MAQHDITEDDLLKMEAFGLSIIDEARRLRAKLQGQQARKDYISPERRARVEAERKKVILKRKLRIDREAKQSSGKS